MPGALGQTHDELRHERQCSGAGAGSPQPLQLLAEPCHTMGPHAGAARFQRMRRAFQGRGIGGLCCLLEGLQVDRVSWRNAAMRLRTKGWILAIAQCLEGCKGFGIERRRGPLCCQHRLRNERGCFRNDSISRESIFCNTSINSAACTGLLT